MRNYNDFMTVEQLINLVGYLQPHYSVRVIKPSIIEGTTKYQWHPPYAPKGYSEEVWFINDGGACEPYMVRTCNR